MKYAGITLILFIANMVYSTTVGYWRFENSGVSQYNSPVLDFTLGSGTSYSDFLPGVHIRDGINGTPVSNTSSYSAGTGHAVLSNTALMNSTVEATNHGFTIESFMYIPDGVGDYFDGVVRGGTDANRWFMGIYNDGKFVFNGLRGLDGAAIRASSANPLSKGMWHHVAAVGTYYLNQGGNPYLVIWLYIDYVKDGGAVYAAASPNGQCLKTSAGEYWFGMYNSNPFFLDEIRVSDVALTPDQFLRADSNPISCDEVWQMGYGIDADLNTDCSVDLGDIAAFMKDWLKCNDPEDANCTWR